MKAVYQNLVRVSPEADALLSRELAVLSIHLTEERCAAAWGSVEKNEEGRLQITQMTVLPDGKSETIPTALSFDADRVVLGKEALLRQTHYRDFVCCPGTRSSGCYQGDITEPSYEYLLQAFFRKVVKNCLKQMGDWGNAKRILIQVSRPMGEDWQQAEESYEQLLQKALRPLSRSGQMFVAVCGVDCVILADNWPVYRDMGFYILHRQEGRYLRQEYCGDSMAKSLYSRPVGGLQQEDSPDAFPDAGEKPVLTLREPVESLLFIGCIELLHALVLESVRAYLEKEPEYTVNFLLKCVVADYQELLMRQIQGVAVWNTEPPKDVSIREKLMSFSVKREPVGDHDNSRRSLLGMRQAEDRLPEILELYRWTAESPRKDGQWNRKPDPRYLVPGYPQLTRHRFSEMLWKIYRENKQIQLSAAMAFGPWYGRSQEQKGGLDAIPPDPRQFVRCRDLLCRQYEKNLGEKLRQLLQERIEKPYGKELFRAAVQDQLEETTGYLDVHRPYHIAYPESVRHPEGLLE